MGESCFLVSAGAAVWTRDLESQREWKFLIRLQKKELRLLPRFARAVFEESNSLWEGYPDVSDEYLCELSKMAFVPGNCPEFIFEISEIAFFLEEEQSLH